MKGLLIFLTLFLLILQSSCHICDELIKDKKTEQEIMDEIDTKMEKLKTELT